MKRTYQSPQVVFVKTSQSALLAASGEIDAVQLHDSYTDSPALSRQAPSDYNWIEQDY